jgi:16S rRNA (uracil1498-N3)-methyltransferase
VKSAESKYSANRIVFVTLPRFYAPDLDPASGRVALSPEESHHLASVMRIAAGADVSAFDGRGHAVRARVERADRRRALLQILGPLEPQPEPGIPITLVQAVLKGDKMDDVIRDATMVGVRRVTPIVTERSQVRLPALAKSHAVERWQRVAISSAKQCGQTRLPAIDPPAVLSDWLDSSAVELRLVLSEPASDLTASQPLRDTLERARPRAVSCVVGPEGGWSAEEHRAAIAAGCVPVTLGAMTLRADAAGLVIASILMFALETGR